MTAKEAKELSDKANGYAPETYIHLILGYIHEAAKKGDFSTTVDFPYSEKNMLIIGKVLDKLVDMGYEAHFIDAHDDSRAMSTTTIFISWQNPIK